MESKARFFFVPHLVGWRECQGQQGIFASSCWNVFIEWEAKQNHHVRQGVLKLHMGVSLNGGTPKTPQNDHFL